MQCVQYTFVTSLSLSSVSSSNKYQSFVLFPYWYKNGNSFLFLILYFHVYEYQQRKNIYTLFKSWKWNKWIVKSRVMSFQHQSFTCRFLIFSNTKISIFTQKDTEMLIALNTMKTMIFKHDMHKKKYFPENNWHLHNTV